MPQPARPYPLFRVKLASEELYENMILLLLAFEGF
jgi:hypothetical protein